MLDDAPDVSLVRAGGSRLQPEMMLGTAATVLCDESKPPFLAIDAGPIHEVIEASTFDEAAVAVAGQRVKATHLHALLAGMIANDGWERCA
jgi:hypothetical protein